MKNQQLFYLFYFFIVVLNFFFLFLPTSSSLIRIQFKTEKFVSVIIAQLQSLNLYRFNPARLN